MSTIIETVNDPVILDIIEQLKTHLRQPYPEYHHQIIEQILSQKQFVIPQLLEMVEQFTTYPPRNEGLEGIIALFILAKFKETRAFPLVVKLCSLPYNAVEELLGSIKSECLNSIIASTFNGDCDILYSLVTNQHLSEHARYSALEAHIILYKYDLLSREQLLNVLNKLFDELFYDFSLVPNVLVSASCNVYAVELYPQIKRYFEHSIIDFDFIDPETVNETFAGQYDKVLYDLQNSHRYVFVEDLYKEIHWLFPKEKDISDDEDDFITARDYKQFISARQEIKIGRNEPCYCDSGKKYKKCCLEFDTA